MSQINTAKNPEAAPVDLLSVKPMELSPLSEGARLFDDHLRRVTAESGQTRSTEASRPETHGGATSDDADGSTRSERSERREPTGTGQEPDDRSARPVEQANNTEAGDASDDDVL